MFKRIASIDIQNFFTGEIPNDNVIIALDSSGIKVTNRGEWLREKWKKRSCAKVHIAVDVSKKRL